MHVRYRVEEKLVESNQVNIEIAIKNRNSKIFEKAKEKEQEKNNKKDTGPKLQQNFWEL